MPATFKAIVDRQGEVLLCQNHSGDWELPGGWPDRDDRSAEHTLKREIREECGIDIKVTEVVAAIC